MSSPHDSLNHTIMLIYEIPLPQKSVKLCNVGGFHYFMLSSSLLRAYGRAPYLLNECVNMSKEHWREGKKRG